MGKHELERNGERIALEGAAEYFGADLQSKESFLHLRFQPRAPPAKTDHDSSLGA